MCDAVTSIEIKIPSLRYSAIISRKSTSYELYELNFYQTHKYGYIQCYQCYHVKLVLFDILKSNALP